MIPAVVIPVPQADGPAVLYGIQYNAQGVHVLCQAEATWVPVDGPIPFQVAIHVTSIAQAGMAAARAAETAYDVYARLAAENAAPIAGEAPAEPAAPAVQ